MIMHCESMVGKEWEDLMPFPATGLSRLVEKTSRQSPRWHLEFWLNPRYSTLLCSLGRIRSLFGFSFLKL